MIGSFGETVFTSSNNKVLTYSSLSRSADARYTEHSLIGKKPQLEFIGPSLDEVSYSIRLDSQLGVDPKTEIDRLRDIRDNGIAKPLFFGKNFVGNFVITGMSENQRITNPRSGRLTLAEISITLKEYTNE